MAEITVLDALQAFHRELIALTAGFGDTIESLDNDIIRQIFEKELNKLLDCPSRNDQSRNTIKSGRLRFEDTEVSINEKFQQEALLLSDELDVDEVDAAKCLFESQDDRSVLGRSLLECGVIRFHQQRKYVLDILRLLLDLDIAEEENEETSALGTIKVFVATRLFQPGRSAAKRYVPRCMAAMSKTKSWLQKMADKIAAAQALSSARPGQLAEDIAAVEFTRVSLIQQHELLGVILYRCIEKREADIPDFMDFVSTLKKVDKYDNLLAHLIPAMGAYISLFGSEEGGYDLIRVRELHGKLFPAGDDSTWPLPHLHAAFRAWWLAEYSGFYLDDPPESAIPPGTDLDEEDRQRSNQFLDALKDGAFDFLLSLAGDVKPADWHDSVRVGMRNWLTRKSSILAVDSVQFAGFFQLCLMAQIEVFVDAFISNLPDVLRKLRVEEDEQRQLSQAHEQDLDLERFLLVIAYAYEGRPDAASNFWSDPESNLAGFMHWASRRASTPLVTAFCEMLQAIAGNDECATAAHEFLLDDSHQSSGKMRRSQSLTWTQIFKELEFFSDKIRQKPASAQPSRYRGGKPSTDVVETEPESAMLLECYLRLMTKLSTESETTRLFLLQNPNYNMVDMLYELASGPVPPRLRGCVFFALKALMSRKTTQECYAMWACLENWMTGGYTGSPAGAARQAQPAPLISMDRILDEMSGGFEDAESLVQLLFSLVSPAIDSSPLNDSLPFPDNLGSSSRKPGIEVYVDFVAGMVFANKVQDLQDKHQLRVLRLSCLDFILACLSTFNEDLIVVANETSINIDSVIVATDLATYVQKHPFARVMEWMFNGKVMTALFNTIHQEPADVGNAAPDSPLILGILRAVEVVTKVLDLEATYLDLVRPLIKAQSGARRLRSVANATYASFQDGLVTRLNLVVDLGNYCGIGHPDLTLACLKLLGKMSSSSKIAATWSGSTRHSHRNKAIVAMEANGEHESIFRSFISDLMTPLEAGREAESPSYITKIYILDFLLSCLSTTPREPTIAHLLLGFKCDVASISIESNGAFSNQTSLFHTLLRLLMEIPSGDAEGIRRWLVAIKAKVIRILHILWSSPLSASLVISELRANEFLFHLLIRETVIQPDILWEGQNVALPHFPVTDGAATLVDFLTLRSIALDYMAMELCMISQGKVPSMKRRIFDALNGQVIGDGNEPIQTPTVFDLFDFLLPEGIWEIPPPPLQFYHDLDVGICLEKDADDNAIHNIDRVREILLLKRSDSNSQGALIIAHDLAAIEREEAMILEYLLFVNSQKQIATQCAKVLRSWTRLLLVMIECSDHKGTAQTSFFLQALQAVLPSLEAFASDRPGEALELATIARVLLSKLEIGRQNPTDRHGQSIGNLVSDKLYQLFQICLQAVAKWAGTPELRSVYYEICYRYLTGMSEQGVLDPSRPKATKTIEIYGERLINVICDDAYCGEPSCQSAALVLLNAFVHVGRQEDDSHVVETLNRLNFIGIVVDSLRNVMNEWHNAYASDYTDQQNYQNARLALLLQIAQSRSGAKYILYANLFRAMDASGLFTADPELQSDAQNSEALQQHYDLLAKVVRIIGAALLSRGSHNIVQGRKFLTDHRMLVTHTLKRSAGIGGDTSNSVLDEKIDDLADALMVMIAATRFLDYETETTVDPVGPTRSLFH